MGNMDRWWDIGNENAVEEMVVCLKAGALPFLERMQSLAEMRDWLDLKGNHSYRLASETMSYAILLSQLGDNDAACAVLVDFERKARGAWKKGAKEVAERIGCDLSRFAQ